VLNKADVRRHGDGDKATSRMTLGRLQIPIEVSYVIGGTSAWHLYQA